MFCYRFFLKFRKTNGFQIGKVPDGRLAGARGCREWRAVRSFISLIRTSSFAWTSLRKVDCRLRVSSALRI